MIPPIAYIPSLEESNDAHTKPILCLRQSPTYLVSGSSDGSVRVWSKKDRKLALGPLTGSLGKSFRAVAISEQLGVVIGGDTMGNVVVWRLEDGKQLLEQACHDHAILSFALREDMLVSSSKDQSAKVWTVDPAPNLPFRLQLRHTLQGHGMAVLSAQITDDRIYTSSGDKSLRIWDKESGELKKSFHVVSSLVQFHIRPGATNEQIVGACSDGTIRLYDLNDDNELARLEGHTSVAYALDVFPANTAGAGKDVLKIASASYDGTVRVWTLQQEKPFSSECLRDLSYSEAMKTPLPIEQAATDGEPENEKKGANRTMGVQVDGDRLYCCGEGAEIVVWDITTTTDDSKE